MRRLYLQHETFLGCLDDVRNTEKYLETLFGHDTAFTIHLFKIVSVFQTNSLTLVRLEMNTGASVV